LKLVDPAVGAGRRVVFILVDVDVEFLAVALEFPVGDFVAEAIEIGIAAEIQIADEHTAKVADVADAALAKAESAEEGEGGHAGDDPLHFNRDRDREDVSASVRKKNCASDENSENGAGSSDRGNVRDWLSPEAGQGLDDNVDDASTDSGEEVVAEKAVLSPDGFDFAAEHPEHKHIEDDVPDVRGVM